MGFDIRVQWQATPGRSAQGETQAQFCRDHLIHYGSGQSIRASSAPEYQGNGEMINPEENLLAALSSCHMLTFLAIAHLKRLPVERYTDNASAELGKLDSGKLAVTKLILRPEVVFAPGVEVSREVLEKIHEKAHANCFIANSLKAEMTLEF